MFKDIKPTFEQLGSVLSPLKEDKSGRFSRKAPEAHRTKKISDLTLTTILVILHISILLSVDLIMFAGSGNLEIFKNSIFPCAEVFLIMLFILLFSAAIVGIFHKHQWIKAVLASLFSFLFVVVIYNQFSQLGNNIQIGVATISSSGIIAFIFASVTFVIYMSKNRRAKILYAFAMVLLFFNVYFAYMKAKESHDFVETVNIQRYDTSSPRRFIYFLFPNLVSPYSLTMFNTPEAEITQKLINGFYQANNFTQYSRAYTKDDNFLNNLVYALNPYSHNLVSNILDTRLLYGYWKFYNLHKDLINLKNNELYDIFYNNHYQISAYKSRDFDMCRKKHITNVARCIEKINKPTKVYDMSVMSKANVLFVEWFYSFKLCKNMLPVYSTLNKFINADKMPLVSVTYNNLYVINSLKAFDVLYSDIEKDTGRQAYFVFMDIPSDMYVYDQYCKMLPKDEWLDISNKPWVTNDYTEERKSAYLQQTKCLYGKMQQFFSNLNKKGLLDDSIIIIQGISGINNFQRKHSEDFKENFMNNRLVNMAVYDKRMKEHRVNNTFCSTTNIVLEYLFSRNRCNSDNDLGVHDKIRASVIEEVENLTPDTVEYSAEDFIKWYKEWQTNNNILPSDDEFMIERKQINNEISEIDSSVVPEF